LRSVSTILIAAPAQAIYELASATERWPRILPHYRYVRVLSEHASERTVEMAARRSFFPVRWVALQRNDESTPAIWFRHLTGWTAGTEVEWRFEERDRITHVSIIHDIHFHFPFAARTIEKHIVMGFFIEGIAQRTLMCMKRAAEECYRG
jgi:ribosome-associated toxin RatA of RatAB toxin-antitoxin module